MKNRCKLIILTLLFFFVGVFVMMAGTACRAPTESGDKYYSNLRFTKNTALFICKAPEGTASTYRANNDALDGSGLCRIEGYSDHDMKVLANRYCKDKHGLR